MQRPKNRLSRKKKELNPHDRQFYEVSLDIRILHTDKETEA